MDIIECEFTLRWCEMMWGQKNRSLFNWGFWVKSSPIYTYCLSKWNILPRCSLYVELQVLMSRVMWCTVLPVTLSLGVCGVLRPPTDKFDAQWICYHVSTPEYCVIWNMASFEISPCIWFPCDKAIGVVCWNVSPSMQHGHVSVCVALLSGLMLVGILIVIILLASVILQNL